MKPLRFVIKPVMALIAMLLACMSWATAESEAYDEQALLAKYNALGVLKAEDTTQGELLWLRGRIAKAVYSFKHEGKPHCSRVIPVAIGGLTKSRLGAYKGTGFTMLVLSQQLSDALSKGNKIHSEDLRFEWTQDPMAMQSVHLSLEDIGSGETTEPDQTTEPDKTKAKPLDGVIIEGIANDEGFILNSRRRWVSWFTGKRFEKKCI